MNDIANTSLIPNLLRNLFLFSSLLLFDAIAPNVKETKELSKTIIDSPFIIPFKPNTITVTTTERITIIFNILSNNKPNDLPPPPFVFLNASFPTSLKAFVKQSAYTNRNGNANCNYYII